MASTVIEQCEIGAGLTLPACERFITTGARGSTAGLRAESRSWTVAESGKEARAETGQQKQSRMDLSSL